jgi:hypothetical protein
MSVVVGLLAVLYAADFHTAEQRQEIRHETRWGTATTEVDPFEAFANIAFVNAAYEASLPKPVPKKPQVVHVTSASKPVVVQTGDFYYRLAMCETGGTMQNLNTGNGYYGYFQFSKATWSANGGTGLPSDFDYETQRKMAMHNITPSNFHGQHPHCSRVMAGEGWVVPID